MILYYLLVPWLYLLSRLPSTVLYRISDALAFVLRVILRYRKQVVLANLRHSFPEKDEPAIRQIAKASYTHLADRVVENIKCLTITPHEIEQRLHTENIHLLDDYYRQGRPVLILIGHIAAWEYAGYKLSLHARYRTFAVVSRLRHPYFNRLVQRTRGKMGMHLVTMQEAGSQFRKEYDHLSAGVFISDQSPPSPQRAYWTTFLHQDTAFFTGAERYARHHNCVVLYARIVQRQRGYYTSSLHVVTEQPQHEPPMAITEKFVRMLETHLREHPADWLWSHKRWKHKRKAKGNP